jgi:hypothetical protein
MVGGVRGYILMRNSWVLLLLLLQFCCFVSDRLFGFISTSKQNLLSFCPKRHTHSFCREEHRNISSGDLGQAKRDAVAVDRGGVD